MTATRKLYGLTGLATSRRTAMGTYGPLPAGGRTQMTTQAFSRFEALKELEQMGSHKIVAIAWANKVGAPFGLKFKETHFTPNGDPKGPVNTCDGVDVHLIAALIADKVGAKGPQFFGRGTQFRSDIEAARKAIS